MNIFAFILYFSFSFLWLSEPFTGKGGATFYHDSFQGKLTASGEPYDRQKLTAAHSTLAFDTYLRVTNPRNGRSVTVRINDRMKAKVHSIIDLSREAAVRIGLVQEGRGVVWLEEVEEYAPAEPLLPLRGSRVFPDKSLLPK